MRNEDEEESKFESFMKAIVKQLSETLDIPVELIEDYYGKEKEKRKKGNWKR